MLFLRLGIKSESMRQVSYILLLILILGFSQHTKAQKDGYKIDVTVKGFQDTTAILAHYLANAMYPDDTVRLDKSGKGILIGKEKLSQGLYLLYLPNGKFFEIIMGNDQHFSLETDTNDYVKNLVVKGSKNNELFAEFQQYMISKRGKLSSIQKKIKATEDKKKKEDLYGDLRKLADERKEKINSIINDNPDLFVSKFLRTTLEFEVPDDIKDDKEKAYNYYKNHYFDNFDISNRSLLYTPLYEDKLLNYLDKVVLQIPDSIIKEVDMIMEKVMHDSVIMRYVLITLFNKYGKSNIMGMDAVQVHIADKYYIDKAYWSSEKFIADLKERVTILKPLLIGKTAPDVQLRHVPSEHFKKAATDTGLKSYPHAGSFFNISQIQADYTVLVFWEATCSHCKKVMPKFHQLYQDSLKANNVKVVAISTLFGSDGKIKWIDFVNNNKLYDWINAWNPYDYKFKEAYDVRSTPQVFVLDKDKKIIGKKLEPENLLQLINAHKNFKQQE